MKYTEHELQRVLDAIPEGQEHAIHQSELARQLNMPPSALKGCIRQLRREHDIISGLMGYWRSTSRDEVAAFLRTQEAQAMARLATIKRMRAELKIPEGQLDLFECEGR